MGTSSFCEGENEESCPFCPNNRTQHPCWFEKVRYWKDESPMVIADRAIPTTRVRSPYDLPPPPKGRTDGSYWQAIPTDERGMPYLDGHGNAMTNKELADMGDHRIVQAKRYVA